MAPYQQEICSEEDKWNIKTYVIFIVKWGSSPGNQIEKLQTSSKLILSILDYSNNSKLYNYYKIYI